MYKILSLVFVASILLGCNKQDWDVSIKSEVKFQSSTNEVTIAGKQFVMDKVEMNLADIQISGETIQSGDVNRTLTVNGNADFLIPNFGNIIELPVGTYPELNFKTEVVSNGAPSVIIHGTYYFPNNNEYDVEIMLNANEVIASQLKDTDGSYTILLEEESQKSIAIQMDTEILFSDVIPGQWNSTAVTEGKIQIDEQTNTNLYNALVGKIGESFIVEFQ